MPDPILSSVIERARAATPAVRAAALLHIARVAAWTDREEGCRLLDEAWDAVRRLHGIDRSEIAVQGWIVTAAVDPARITPAVARDFAADWTMRHSIERVFETMLQHAEPAAVAAVLMSMPDWESSLFRLVHRLGDRCDESTQRDLARTAAERWREARKQNAFRADVEFRGAFKWACKHMPADEARSLGHEVVASIADSPEGNFTSTFGPDSEFTLHGRACFYFDVIDAVQSLDPALADHIAKSDRQLQSALARYPRGMTSVHEEADRLARERAGTTEGGGFVMMGGGDDDFAYLIALQQAKDADDFRRVMTVYAEKKYAKDADTRQPNGATKEYWPSANRYRQIIESAAKRLGDGAAPLLEKIRDPDLRLFAEIEMIATRQGLPPAYRTDRGRPPQSGTFIAEPDVDIGQKTGDRGGGPKGPRIRCPKCGWEPRPDDRWACTCGHSWNTFDTGGVCPGCMHQWAVTQCLRCHEYSPHSDWYGED